MTNRIAIALALAILSLLAADHYWLHVGLPLMSGQKMAAFVEWVSFWR